MDIALVFINQEINSTKWQVDRICYNVSELTTEQKVGGYEVDFSNIPAIPEQQFAKGTPLYINPLDKSMWFEYIDRPLKPEEQIQKVTDDNTEDVLVLSDALFSALEAIEALEGGGA